MAILNAPGVTRKQVLATISESARLPRWRKARGQALQGIRPGPICMIGDSNTSGFRTIDASTHSKAASTPAILSALLDTEVGAENDSFFGIGVTSANFAAYSAYNPKVTAGAGWSFATVSAGGEMFTNTTTANALTFNPGVDWDTAEIR